MKKPFSSTLFLTSLGILLIALTFSGSVLGQSSIEVEGREVDLESAIDSLAQNQLEITQLLKTSLLGDPGPSEEEIQAAAYLDPNLFPFSNCYTGYTNWPSSNSYDEDGLFATHFVHTTERGFKDINGDGILDFLTTNTSNNGTSHFACLLLGNGSGFQIGYRCRRAQGKFYGDCAA